MRFAARDVDAPARVGAGAVAVGVGDARSTVRAARRAWPSAVDVGLGSILDAVVAARLGGGAVGRGGSRGIAGRAASPCDGAEDAEGELQAIRGRLRLAHDRFLRSPQAAVANGAPRNA